MKTALFVIIAACFVQGCALTKAQQEVSGNSILSGHYIYTSTGTLYDQTGSQGQSSLPSFVPIYIPETLWDGGTMEADGQGHITQCGGASWGTYTSAMNCATHWTVQMGVSDDGVPVNGRYGYGKSNIGDSATISCTETGKICVMTSHNVGWSWSARLERE